MNSSTYATSFAKFLHSTAEKQILADAIRDLVDLSPHSRLLDIGAGQGELATLLQPNVEKILAIEPNPVFAQSLQKKRINHVSADWGIAQPDGVFDVVLASHVITYFPDEQLSSLVQKMLQYVRKGGRLVVLTVDQHQGSWREIHSLFYEWNGIQKRKTSTLLPSLLVGHKVTSSSCVSHVTTATVDDMLDVLRFDFSAYPEAFAQSSARIKAWLSAKLTEGTVQLDVVHQITVVEK